MAALLADRDALKKAEVTLSGLAVVFVLLVGSGFAYLALFDTKPPVSSTYVRTLNERGEPQTVFRAGDTMLVERDLCFSRDTTARFGRKLRTVDEPYLNVEVDTTVGYIKRGCVDNANVVQIPVRTPPRRYKFSVVMQYSNNPFQEGAVTLPEPEITVIR